MKSSVVVAEIDLGPCALCGAPILAGQEYVSVIDAAVDGTIDRVSNRHADCHPEPADGVHVGEH